MQIILCDDNVEILKQLQTYITEFFCSYGASPELVAYTSGEELLQNVDCADIAFLDVEMAGINGIYVGTELKRKNPYIKIFIVTAYPDYLDDAMRFQVFRYLSKPIDKSRLFRNLKEALYQYSMESKEFAIETNDGVYIRRAEEIIYVEAINRKSLIYTTDGTLESNKPLSYWSTILSLPCFYCTHRSFVVNLRFVYTIQKDCVYLKHNKRTFCAYLSRRKYTNFKQTYLLYLESVK